eukprot:gene17172-biopygen3842
MGAGPHGEKDTAEKTRRTNGEKDTAGKTAQHGLHSVRIHTFSPRPRPAGYRDISNRHRWGFTYSWHSYRRGEAPPPPPFPIPAGCQCTEHMVHVPAPHRAVQ